MAIDEHGQPIRLRELLIVDAWATLGAGLFGSSSGTASVASIAGIRMGGRTGTTVKGIAFDRLEVAVPAFARLVLIPLTFSITQGILWGFVLHALRHQVVGRSREVTPGAWGLAVLSAVLLALEHTR